MGSKSALTLFFKQFETGKARTMHSWVRYLVWIHELVTGEHVCTKCNMSTLVREYPGEFRDFDADPDQGGDGVPLCTICVGTGKFKKDSKFKKLQEAAKEAREDSYRLLGQVIENDNWQWYYGEIRKVNVRLMDCAREALAQIKYPAKNCLATLLAKSKIK